MVFDLGENLELLCFYGNFSFPMGRHYTPEDVSSPRKDEAMLIRLHFHIKNESHWRTGFLFPLDSALAILLGDSNKGG